MPLLLLLQLSELVRGPSGSSRLKLKEGRKKKKKRWGSQKVAFAISEASLLSLNGASGTVGLGRRSQTLGLPPVTKKTSALIRSEPVEGRRSEAGKHRGLHLNGGKGHW